MKYSNPVESLPPCSCGEKFRVEFQEDRSFGLQIALSVHDRCVVRRVYRKDELFSHSPDVAVMRELYLGATLLRKECPGRINFDLAADPDRVIQSEWTRVEFTDSDGKRRYAMARIPRQQVSTPPATPPRPPVCASFGKPVARKLLT